jgi:hypothetical protein
MMLLGVCVASLGYEMPGLAALQLLALNGCKFSGARSQPLSWRRSVSIGI